MGKNWHPSILSCIIAHSRAIIAHIMARKPNPALDTQVAILARSMPKGKIAEALGIQRSTVRRALARQAVSVEQAEAKLKEYQATMTSLLPDQEIAERLKAITLDQAHPNASMRAIEHRDRILGYLKPPQESATSATPASLFQLPDGATIGILVKPKS